MGLTKSENFTKQAVDMAEIAKALSHPARIEILNYLLENQSCICGDLVDILPLSQSTVSQHLSELKKAGLIKGEINPPKVCYCIDIDAWNIAKNVFSAWFGKLNVINTEAICC